jgi:hypothetical protein
MVGYMKLTRRNWYNAGGFAESRCVRRMRGGAWQYFYRMN